MPHKNKKDCKEVTVAMLHCLKTCVDDVVRKYNGDEMDIAKFITFRFKYFRLHFVYIFLNFVSISICGIKIFLLSDVSVSVNVNDTDDTV